MSAVSSFIRMLREEFRGYDRNTFRQDVLSALTVAAVALPLALAFGIASGSTPAAGLVTAIIAGVVIGGLSGASFQISGPTGAMSAVLILVANQYGSQALLLVGAMAGALILLIGLFKLGRTVLLIPRPVITGFTSGIAIIIFVG
jgi:SulP family sulfate permease